MQNPLLSVLKIPSFLFLLISEFFSQFAMNLLNFVLLLVAFDLSKSNMAVAGVVLSFTVPSIVFGILAGVYVDKWNKKNVLVYTNLLRALAAFPLIFVSHELFLVYLFSFLISLITQFFIPAETPIIPLLVEKKLLLSANALFSMGIFGSMIVAYALSGPLLLLFGKVNVFIFITILFAVSGFFAFLIKLKKPEPHVNADLKIFEELRDAFSLMAKKENIYHSLFLLTLLQTLILIIAVIGPGYATNILHIQVEKFPVLFVTPAVIGMSFGAFLIGNFWHKRSKQQLAKIGLLVIGIVMILFPYLNNFIFIANNLLSNISLFSNVTEVHILLIFAVVIGFAFSLVFVPSNTLIQEETTDRQRGKIYGSLNTLVGVISIIPILGVGFLADYIGVGQVITIIGIIVVAIAALRFFKFK
ncbi:MFS transporter [Candidatus Dojkabacteria bacterium]|uniref:MFS transporter n=1 Tax=Candidatus Dojkabacteria bacterium TaxID=2099670 RepID=A0A5C7J531_9BACT|nr:MAG: MFS transporter [Candidatus Dojkabacteria bacterium]